jgi:hypothetical protein
MLMRSLPIAWAAVLVLLLGFPAPDTMAAQGQRFYIDGNGALKSSISGGNGTSDTTGTTLFDVNGNAIGAANPLGTADTAADGSLASILAKLNAAVAVTPSPANAAGAFSGTTLGTAAASILAANTAKVFLQIVNASTTNATVWVSFAGTAAVGGAGSIPIGPGGSLLFSGTFVPSDAVSAIATAASTPITIGVK